MQIVQQGERRSGCLRKLVEQATEQRGPVETGVDPLRDKALKDATTGPRAERVEDRSARLKGPDALFDPAVAQIVPQTLQQRHGIQLGAHDRSMRCYGGEVQSQSRDLIQVIVRAQRQKLGELRTVDRSEEHTSE